jgi:mono/diheme cytochrome c family protein
VIGNSRNEMIRAYILGVGRWRRGKSNVFFRLALFLAVSVFVALIGTKARAQEIESIPKPEAPVHGDAKNGKRLYDAHGCYECHGGQGQGSPLSGPRIAPEPMHFGSFVRYIRMPSGQMPPYTSRVTTDAELTDIYSFLQSIPHPPEAKKIPLLAPPAGPEKQK